jgi:hypothetical protein
MLPSRNCAHELRADGYAEDAISAVTAARKLVGTQA